MTLWLLEGGGGGVDFTRFPKSNFIPTTTIRHPQEVILAGFDLLIMATTYRAYTGTPAKISQDSVTQSKS